MTATSDGFRTELRRILDALENDLGGGRVEPVVAEGVLRTNLDKGVLLVPATYESHWRRFGTMPTALVRDAAYAIKRRRLQSEGVSRAQMEADAHAYAEQFLRAVSLPDSD